MTEPGDLKDVANESTNALESDSPVAAEADSGASQPHDLLAAESGAEVPAARTPEEARDDDVGGVPPVAAEISAVPEVMEPVPGVAVPAPLQIDVTGVELLETANGIESEKVAGLTELAYAEPGQRFSSFEPDIYLNHKWHMKPVATVIVLAWRKGREVALGAMMAEHQSANHQKKFPLCEDVSFDEAGNLSLAWTEIDERGRGVNYRQPVSEGEIFVLHDTGKLEVMSLASLNEQYNPY